MQCPALVCHPDLLARRLRGRPAWRGWDEARIEEMLASAATLRAEGPHMHPPVELLDTDTLTAADVAEQVVDWATRAADGTPPASPP
jgi:hypothetical protein